MEGGESPLDVLSRAATMIQENQKKHAALSSTSSSSSSGDESTKQTTTKQLPTTKWKRERRSRAEYSRKSDPKIAEIFQDHATDTDQSINNGGYAVDKPLDMSIRQRGLPPSYSQTMNNPGFRSSYRSSAAVIATNGTTTTTQRDELPSGMSMCDPIIDEHFRRSLGKDYVSVFSNNNRTKTTEKEIASKPTTKTLSKTTSSVIELMDDTGLSVDDHFAKALGDTWLKLNGQKDEMKNNNRSSETPQAVTI